MTDSLRKKYTRRAQDAIALANGVTPAHLQKTPSQKSSERLRKRLNRGKTTPDPEPQSDCRDCQKERGCPYNNNLSSCHERSLVLRCKKCGQKVRFRVIVGVAWELCPVCKAQVRQ